MLKIYSIACLLAEASAFLSSAGFQGVAQRPSLGSRNIALNLWMSGQAKPSKEPGFVKEFNFEKLDQNKTLEWLQVPLMNFHGIAMVAPAKFGSCVCVHLGLGQGRGNRQCANGG